MSASRADLDWWWSLAREVQWTYASTFAKSAPHWYVRLGSTRGMNRDDFLKVGELIRRYGTPGKFYGRVNLYLINPEGTHKVWRMWEEEPSPEPADLINLAHTDRTYGPQTFSAADLPRVRKLRLPANEGD